MYIAPKVHGRSCPLLLFLPKDGGSALRHMKVLPFFYLTYIYFPGCPSCYLAVLSVCTSPCAPPHSSMHHDIEWNYTDLRMNPHLLLAVGSRYHHHQIKASVFSSCKLNSGCSRAGRHMHMCTTCIYKSTFTQYPTTLPLTQALQCVPDLQMYNHNACGCNALLLPKPSQ